MPFGTSSPNPKLSPIQKGTGELGTRRTGKANWGQGELGTDTNVTGSVFSGNYVGRGADTTSPDGTEGQDGRGGGLSGENLLVYNTRITDNSAFEGYGGALRINDSKHGREQLRETRVGARWAQ